MICQGRGRRCDSCGGPATRRRLDRVTRRMLDLCDRCPSPAELLARKAAVQAGWDPGTRQAREFDCNREGVDHRLAVDFSEPVCFFEEEGDLAD